MHTYSDEPVLIKPRSRFSRGNWLAMVCTAGLIGGLVYIPVNKTIMDERAHDAPRGSRSGSTYPITIEGKPHVLELSWSGSGNFAPTLMPTPAPGTLLMLASRAGKESLTWNETFSAFGPGTVTIDPLSHYKLDLTLTQEGRTVWRDSLWAYGFQDHSGHNH